MLILSQLDFRKLAHKFGQAPRPLLGLQIVPLKCRSLALPVLFEALLGIYPEYHNASFRFQFYEYRYCTAPFQAYTFFAE